MSIEKDPCPPACVQEGRTAYYETFKQNEEAYRTKTIAGMSWLRPFDRISRMRDVGNSNRRIAMAERIITESRSIDARIITGDVATAQAEVQVEPLPFNAATQNEAAIV